MPEIMAAKGAKIITRTLTEEEFIPALENKLLEEVQEMREPGGDKLVQIAYIFEILDAMKKALALSDEAIAAERAAKYAERGGFEKRLFLEGKEE